MLSDQLLQSSAAAQEAAMAAAKRSAERARRLMRAEARRQSLSAQHAKLEYEILVERQRPRPDDARLSALKLEKLHVKEALEALKRETPSRRGSTAASA